MAVGVSSWTTSGSACPLFATHSARGTSILTLRQLPVLATHNPGAGLPPRRATQSNFSERFLCTVAGPSAIMHVKRMADSSPKKRTTAEGAGPWPADASGLWSAACAPIQGRHELEGMALHDPAQCLPLGIQKARRGDPRGPRRARSLGSSSFVVRWWSRRCASTTVECSRRRETDFSSSLRAPWRRCAAPRQSRKSRIPSLSGAFRGAWRVRNQRT